MRDKQMNEKDPKSKYSNRFVWGIIVVALVLFASVASCQWESSMHPSTYITPTLTSASVTDQKPTSSQKRTSPTPLSRPTREGKDAFMIQLHSRQFVPEPEIRSGLNWIHSITCERVHMLLQLYGPPSSEDKALLARSGIQLLNYIPSNAWFASVPCSIADDDPALTVIRWLGPILPEDKLSVDLLKGSIGTWALREGNRVAVEVAFFDDVDLNVGIETIKAYDAVVVGETSLSNKITIEVPRDSILELATEDSVRWIDLVPPPPVTH